MALFLLLGVFCCTLICFAPYLLRPKPFPGISYNKDSAGYATGDIFHLVAAVKSAGGNTGALLAISTRKLKIPVAQVLFPIFRRPLVVVDDPIETENILFRRHHEFDVAQTALDVMEPVFKTAWVSQFTTPQLRSQKRLWVDAMRTDFLRKSVAPIIYRSTSELIEFWRLKVSIASNEQTLDVLPDLKDSALDIIWAALVGEESGILKADIDGLQDQMLRNTTISSSEIPNSNVLKTEMSYISNAISSQALSPYPKWIKSLCRYTPRHRQFRARVNGETSRLFRKIADQYSSEKHAQSSEFANDCIMGTVFRRYFQDVETTEKRVKISDEQQLTDQMIVILAAGYESIATAITWFIKFMSAEQGVQDELRAMLKSSFPQPPGVEEILSAEIPCLDAIWEETIRMAGVSKGNLRQALVDTEVLRHKIPRGTEILLNFHLYQLSPDSFTDDYGERRGKREISKRSGTTRQSFRDLKSFDPTRWLERDERSGELKFNPNALPQLGFRGGYRGCYGRKFAAIEFRIVIVLLILNFRFLELAPNLASMEATERILRVPNSTYAKLEILGSRKE